MKPRIGRASEQAIELKMPAETTAPATAARHRVVADAPAPATPLREGTCSLCNPARSGAGAEAGPDVSLLGAIRSRERGNARSAPAPAAATFSSPSSSFSPSSTSPSLLLASARFSSLRLAAALDAAAVPVSSDNSQVPPPFFARRRSKIVEAASATVGGGGGDGSDGAGGASASGRSSAASATTTLLLALTAAGGCAAFCRRTGALLTHLNASGDDVIRSIFLNRARKEVVAVSVCRGDAFASLRCRAVPLSAVAACRGLAASSAAALLSSASRPLFEGEELRWPGFVEFDDVNGVVLTRSGGSCGGSGGASNGSSGSDGNGEIGENTSTSPSPSRSPSPSPNNYAVHDLSNYSLRSRVDGTGVREVRTAPGLLLLVMEPRTSSSPLGTAAETSTATDSTSSAGGGGVPCRLLSIADGTLLAAFDAPAPPGGGGRLDFIELFGHTLLVGGGTPPTLTRVDLRKAALVSATATAKGKKSIVAAASPPAPFPTPSAFIFLHEARLFLAFVGEQRTSAAAAAGVANNHNNASLLPSSSVVVCDGAGARIRSLDGAVSVGSARSPGGPAANSVYLTADQQFIVSYSSRPAAAAAAATATAVGPSSAAPSPAASSSRQGFVAARGRCSCGAVLTPGPSSASASPSPATSSGCQQRQQQLLRRPRALSSSSSDDEELEQEEEEEEIGGVITVSHVLSGRCVARLSAKKLREKRTKKTSTSKRAKIDDDDSDGDGGEVDFAVNDAIRKALSDVSALFYDEETGDLITGSADGHVHVWSNQG